MISDIIVEPFDLCKMKLNEKYLANAHDSIINEFVENTGRESSSIFTIMEATDYTIKSKKGLLTPNATIYYYLKYIYLKIINIFEYNPEIIPTKLDNLRIIFDKLFHSILLNGVAITFGINDTPINYCYKDLTIHFYDGPSAYIYLESDKNIIYSCNQEMLYIFIINESYNIKNALSSNLFSLKNITYLKSKSHLSIPNIIRAESKEFLDINTPCKIIKEQNRYTHLTFESDYYKIKKSRDGKYKNHNKRAIYFKSKSVEVLLQTILIYNSIVKYFMFIISNKDNILYSELMNKIKKYNPLQQDSVNINILNTFIKFIPNINVNLLHTLINFININDNIVDKVDYSVLIRNYQTIFNEKIITDKKLQKVVKKFILSLITKINVNIILEKIRKDKVIMKNGSLIYNTDFPSLS